MRSMSTSDIVTIRANTNYGHGKFYTKHRFNQPYCETLGTDRAKVGNRALSLKSDQVDAKLSTGIFEKVAKEPLFKAPESKIFYLRR